MRLKSRFSFAVSLAVVGFLAAVPASAETLNLFVMAGQSNMVGYKSDAASYPSAPKVDPLIPFYWVEPKVSSSRGTWVTLQPQDGLFPTGHFGPEVTFARTLRTAKSKVAIFKYASGSTSLAQDWLSPGAHGLYDAMARELQAAIAWEQQSGNTVTVRALVWIQGESDGETPAMATAYEPRLRRIIEEFRTDVTKRPRLPVILGVDEQHPYLKVRPEIVAAQAKIAADTPCVVATSMLGLPKADATHLTPAGVIAHGKRLADAYKQLPKDCTAP